MSELHQLLSSSYASYVKQAKTKEEYTPEELDKLIRTARHGSSWRDWLGSIGLGGLGGSALGGYVNAAFPALDAGINSLVIRGALKEAPKALAKIDKRPIKAVVENVVDRASSLGASVPVVAPVTDRLKDTDTKNNVVNGAISAISSGIGPAANHAIKELKKRVPICGMDTPTYVYSKAKDPFIQGALVGLLPGMGAGAITNALLAESRKFEAQDILDKIGVDWEKRSSMTTGMHKIQKIAALTKLSKLQRAAKAVYIIKQAEDYAPTPEELAILKQLAVGKNPGWLKSIGTGIGVGAGLGGGAGALLGALADPESQRMFRRFGHTPTRAELALAGGIGSAINGGVLGAGIGAIRHALTRSGRQAVAIEKLKQLGIDL